MTHKVASALETTLILATLVAGALFAFDSLETGSGQTASATAPAAIVSTLSTSPANAAKPALIHTGGSGCGQTACSFSEGVILHPIVQVPF